MKDYLKDVGSGIAKSINSVDILGRKHDDSKTSDHSIKVITDEDLDQSVSTRGISLDLRLQSGDDKATPSDDTLDDYSLKGMFRVNKGFVAALILTMGCAGFQIGHLISSLNQLSSTFAARYPQYNENHGTSLTFLAGVGIAGALLGSVLAHWLLRLGRKRVFILSTFVALAGTVITLIDGMAALYLGRFIYGIGCGILSLCAPLYLEETLPSRLATVYQTLYLGS